MILIILYLLAAGAIAYGLYRAFPEATRRWVYRIQTARKGVFTALYAASMLVFLASGYMPLFIVGLAMATFAFVQLLLTDSVEVV